LVQEDLRVQVAPEKKIESTKNHRDLTTETNKTSETLNKKVYVNVLDRNDLRIRIPQENEWFPMTKNEKEWWKKNANPDSEQAYPFLNDLDFNF